MTVKICWQDVGPQEGELPARLRQAITDAAKEAVRPDTEVDVQSLEKMAGPSDLSSYRLLNQVEMLRRMVQADQKGYDALVMGCNLDPLFWEAKEVLRTPVVTAGESSVLWGLALGERLGIVTSYESHVPLLNTIIAQTGLHDRFVTRQPVNSIDMTREEFLQVFENRKDLVNRIKENSEILINEGAEVIVAGCVILGVLLAQEKVIEAAPGVPMINPIHVTIKKAEAVADLKRAGIMPDYSRKLRYRQPTDEQYESLKKSLGA